MKIVSKTKLDAPDKKKTTGRILRIEGRYGEAVTAHASTETVLPKGLSKCTYLTVTLRG